ncbi:MAG: hypothetical protein EON58_15985, partial [Alphaproteobacteria bacterium]
MKAIIRPLLVLAILAPIPLAPALAHHSYAMFDLKKTLALKATVTRFKWQNPHAFIEADVQAQGGVERWAIEMTSPNNLQQSGWKRTTLKAGDKVTIYVNPLRNGSKGGNYAGIRLPDGTSLG